MNNKDGLKKLYLIKSAGYEYEEIDLSANTLLLGESGVGKTTIMRAVLFFYTMDYSDSMLNVNPDTKKSFNDWYFKEHNSHLVYEYTKEENNFLFIVSKSGKLHYTFVDMTNSSLSVEELFLDGIMPLNLEKLNENIQVNNLPNYSTTKREHYINTFHKKDADNRKIKQDATTNFTLFETIGARKEFAKTLSNIFASSKVSSNSLKKSIVSLINDSQAKINLNDIKTNLNEYITEKLEIEKFEGKIPVIERLAQTHKSYKESKKEFKYLANNLESLKQNTAIEIEKNNANTLTLTSQKEALDIQFKVDSGLSKEKISKKEKQISITSNSIETLKERETYYSTKNIEQLVINQTNEQNIKNSLENASQRYEALTAGTHNIKTKYQKIKEELDKAIADSLQNILNQSQEDTDKINHKINYTIETKEQKILESSQKSLDEKTALKLQLKTNTNSFNDTKISLATVEYFPFNKEKIEGFTDELRKFEKEHLKTESSITDNTYQITKVEEDIKKIEAELKDSTTKLDEKITKAKELLFTQKAEIEKKLDFESENLYGFLNRNNIRHKEKIVTYLKDEILFSDKKFSTKQIVHDSAIFGLELAFDEEFTNEYKQVKLLEQLKLIKEKIKDLNKKVQKEKKNLQESAEQETKEKNRQRGALYTQKESLKEKNISYTKSIALANENLEIAKKEAEQQRDERIEKLQKESALLDISVQNLGTQIQTITDKIQAIKDDITDASNHAILNFKEEIKEINLTKKSAIENVKSKHLDDAQLIQAELDEALKKEGVDESLLKEIFTEIKNLKTKLEDIDKNRTTVTVYLSEYKEKIRTLPQQISDLQKDERLRDELKDELLGMKKTNTNQVKELQEQQAIVKKIKNNLEMFLRAYKEKIENQDIAKSIKSSLTLENKPSSFSLESNLSDKVDEIVGLYRKIKDDETKIESLVNNCRLVLKPNNTFKIKIENDYVNSISYLKTAKELISYIQDDKLSLLKEYSSEIFKSSLNSIKKELAIFEDAMLDVESEIIDLRNTINKAVNSFNVIDSIKIRFENSNHNILNSLKSLSSFYDENNEKFLSGLFHSELGDTQTQRVKEELSSKISKLIELLKSSKEHIELEDGFVLEFKVVENGNDLKWRQTLNDIGSNGTSTLVKSIINISMLQMVSKNITKDAQILSHCILDEIGTISTDYFKELKEFVNRSGFVFLNGMPIEDDMLISMYPTIYVGQKHANYSRMILASTMEI